MALERCPRCNGHGVVVPSVGEGREPGGLIFTEGYAPDPFRGLYVEGNTIYMDHRPDAHIKGPCRLTAGWTIKPSREQD